jgi:Asp-tRNA(Asn)/Glu-tRNA(Gln) amidotransferase A subunit family amidase
MGRTVAQLEQMMQALVPSFAPRRLESLEELEVAVAWADGADPLVRTRVEEAAARFPRRRSLELPPFKGVWGVFWREVADVHRELYAENADLYGENVGAKIERCLALTDAEYEASLAALAAYRAQMEDILDGIDLLVTPTLPCVAVPTPADELALRDTLIRFTAPFNALGRPALALPCGPAEDGLPASIQLVGANGEDALVLAAGTLLEAALASPI